MSKNQIHPVSKGRKQFRNPYTSANDNRINSKQRQERSTSAQLKARAIALEKFYTKPAVASYCVNLAAVFINGRFCVEPSAGSGNFIAALEEAGIDCCGFDIAPETTHPAVKKLDFLSQPIAGQLPAHASGRSLAVIGNPPFGRRGKLAANFLNKALGEADFVCFVLPITAEHWDFQRRVRGDAKLLLSKQLPAESFTLNGASYAVECCFQIWSLRAIRENIRIKAKPLIKHPDFEMWRYNTQGNPAVLDSAWEFALLCQSQSTPAGFVFKKGEYLCRKKQWIMIKPKTDDSRRILSRLDFGSLSWGASAAKGFGKSRIVTAYVEALHAENDNEQKASDTDKSGLIV